MKQTLRVATPFLGLFLSANAFALCGDVNGDGKRLTGDALLVLKSAVGQAVNLVCDDSGPSRMRYYNDFTCLNFPTSQAKFHGLTFVAESAEYSAYQTVNHTQITDVEINMCGGTYTFPGPIRLPPNRSLSFLMLLLDPDVYGTENGDPAFFAVLDDGAPADSLAEPTQTSANVVAILKGTRTD